MVYVKVYHNEGRVARFENYSKDTASLVEVWDADLKFFGTDAEYCGKVFEMLNVGVRPTGYDFRSLSVGDVIELRDTEGTRYYAVANIGFQQLSPSMMRIMTMPEESNLSHWDANDFHKKLDKLQTFLKECGDNMNSPAQHGIGASIEGDHLDSAGVSSEFQIVLSQESDDGNDKFHRIHLTDLLALARFAKIPLGSE